VQAGNGIVIVVVEVTVEVTTGGIVGVGVTSTICITVRSE
jgi:hypothetical protein